MGSHTTTKAEQEVLIAELRQTLSARTCCGSPAAEIALRVSASFTLDYFNDNRHQAAAALLKSARAMAHNIRTGAFAMNRVRQ